MTSFCDITSKQFGVDNDNDNDNEVALQFHVYKIIGTRGTFSDPRDLQRVHTVNGCRARTSFVLSHEYPDIYILSMYIFF